ncbi:MAG TPA: nucleotidyltransferase family protein [Gemmatimonadaceae bacterium]|nr:nucleotidyltransferase family protein [Gemmatimonadaceae bacterium]
MISPHPEVDLVFRLAARERTPHQGMSFASVGDWRRLVQFASDENALIALRGRLKDRDGDAIPVEVERQIAILSLDREFRMRRLQQRVEDSIAALNQAGIEPLLLKGAALAYTLYGSFEARPMKDVDLLVAPDRADEARAIMLKQGWALDPELPGDERYDTHHHLPPLRDLTASGLRLEIHRGVLPLGHPFHFTDDVIWRAARRVKVGNGHALVMHPSHHAVHIAIHFAWAHMLNLGAWHAFRDLSHLAARDVLDWTHFARTAEEWGASTCCYWTLRLGQSLASVAVPEAVLRRLAPGIPEFVRRPLTRHFARALARSDVGCPSARLNRALWTLAMQPERCGHRAIRPWLVSLDLLSAFDEKTLLQGRGRPASALLRLRRSSRYLTEILA